MTKQKTYIHKSPFKLEQGRSLPELEIAYTAEGDPNNPVVWICHALTANADPFEWWPGIVGDNCIINSKDHYIVCANILGSCYGTTGPVSTNAELGKPWTYLFPEITIRDMVAAHELLRKHLKIKQVDILIGASLGGQQALEWAIQQPNTIKNLALLASNAQHSAWGIAFNESQRLAIQADRTFYNHSVSGGQSGLRAARAVALLSYRGYDAYNATQSEETNHKTDDFLASSYQRYQGDKLVQRFNAHSYYILSKTMDSHNVGRNRGSVENALGMVKANTLVISVSSDILFPPIEQEQLASGIPNAQLKSIHSKYGHDGFLIEFDQISTFINEFFQSSSIGKMGSQQTAESQ